MSLPMESRPLFSVLDVEKRFVLRGVSRAGEAPQLRALGLTTTALGGSVAGTDANRPASAVALSPGDAVAVALPARYRITYRTLANDLSTLG